jgi:hypothetical protein
MMSSRVILVHLNHNETVARSSSTRSLPQGQCTSIPEVASQGGMRGRDEGRDRTGRETGGRVLSSIPDRAKTHHSLLGPV